MFQKYQHVERLGTSEVQGILEGTVHVFPKIDGTNASVWWEGKLCFGSRNRLLGIDSDNAGFMATMRGDQRLIAFFKQFPDARLFGEWLVPHSLRTYTDDAWRKFYVFDVMLGGGQCSHTDYETYSCVLDNFGIDYIPCIAKITSPTQAKLLEWCGKNTFLIRDGEGCGEGIVIKNYLYANGHKRQTWAKIVTNEFKEKHTREMGPCEQKGEKLVEVDIIDQFCTGAFIEKTYHNMYDPDSWTSKRIPELLGRVWHDFVTEETWHYVKKFKNPVVNYRTLFGLVVQKIKKTLPEVFNYF